MQEIKRLWKRLKTTNTYAKHAFSLGLTLMIGFYITALIAYWFAPQAPDYLYVISICRGSLEAAPACLIVGIGAALLGDLLLERNEDNES